MIKFILRFISKAMRTSGKVFKRMPLNVLFLFVIVFGVLNLYYLYKQRRPAHYPEMVKEAIVASGKNRKELRDYLDYYSKPEDSIKLKAAYFLVGNMPGHYGLRYKLTSVFSDSIDYRLITRKTSKDYRLNLDSLGARFKVAGGAYDIHKITSSFLVENTDLAFEAWEKPWCRHLNFEQFCEYILPYRVQNEALSNWRRYFSQKYRWIADSVSDPNDTRAVCAYLQEQLKKEVSYNKGYAKYYSGYVGYEILNNVGIGACQQLANYNTMCMRACGIPITNDQILRWATADTGHIYNTINCNDSVTNYFFSLSDGPPIPFQECGKKGNRAVKVWRRTYGKQQNKILALKETQEIPPSFTDVHHQDVTPYFSDVDTLQLKLSRLPEDGGLVYLCLFDQNRIKPVEWSEVSTDSVVTFKNTTKGLMYEIKGYRNKEFYPIGYPVYLNQNGETLEKRPDYTQVCDLAFMRKAKGGGISRIDGIDRYFNIWMWDFGWKSFEVKGKPYIIKNTRRWEAIENPDKTNSVVYYRLKFKNIPKQGLYKIEKNNRLFFVKNGRLKEI